MPTVALPFLLLTLLALPASAQERVRLHLSLEGLGGAHPTVRVSYAEGVEGRRIRRIGWRPGRPALDWEVDRRPIIVDVRTSEHFVRRVEVADAADLPLRPGEAEDGRAVQVLRITLEARPRITGFVGFHSAELDDLRLWFERLDGDGSFVTERHRLAPWEPVSHATSSMTTQGPRFDLAAPLNPGRYELRAWSFSQGYTTSAPFQVRADGVPEIEQPLRLELDPTLARLEGRIVVPEGADPTEAAVADSWSGGWWSVDSTGRFVVPGGPPGIRVLQLIYRPRPDPDAAEEWLDFDGQVIDEPPREHERPLGTNVAVNDGTPREPPWNPRGTTLRVQLEAGAGTPVVFDLSEPAPCRLEGRLVAPFPMPGREAENVWAGGEGPRVRLERRGHPGYASRSELAADGTFALAVFEPGRYRLRIDLARERGPGVIIDEWLELEEGTRKWELSLEVAELEVPGRFTNVPELGPDERVWSHLTWRHSANRDPSEPERELVVRYPRDRHSAVTRLYHAQVGRVDVHSGGTDERLPQAGDLRPPGDTIEVRAVGTNRLPARWR